MHCNRPVQILLYVLTIITWWSDSLWSQPTPESKKVNLAIRRTADKLLRVSGDDTSRIGAVEQINALTWRLQLDQPFAYDSLPALLQASLDFYAIKNSYDVTVRQCENGTIDLGYQQLDFTQDSLVPCGGRATNEGCHYIEIAFVGEAPASSNSESRNLLIFLGLTGGAGIWWWLRRKSNRNIPESNVTEDAWIEIGHSRMHLQKQILEFGGAQQVLTYREAKLLNLFASHPNELLEREFIHQQVWSDEGLQVSRSVDVFVSRLRKKLASDTSIGITSVHGVGYKLEVKS
ncbi:MAG: winged helix-turn-helix domain-containing protein [Saprospiraceae bacterium]